MDCREGNFLQPLLLLVPHFVLMATLGVATTLSVLQTQQMRLEKGSREPQNPQISGSLAAVPALEGRGPPEPAQWYLSFLEVLVWGQDILHSSKLSFWVSLPQPSTVALAGPTKAPSITQLAGDRTAHQGLKELQSLSHLDCGEQYDRI